MTTLPHFTDTQWAKFKETLDRDGFVVVPGVITFERAQRYESQFWDWLESLNPGKILREDPSTWYGPDFPQTLHGIFKHYGVGHQQFMWDARDEQGMYEFYQRFWHAEGLVSSLGQSSDSRWENQRLYTSFDGCCMLKPISAEAAKRTRGWMHTDQAPTVRGTVPLNFRCLQGFLNLRDCGPDDGGLHVARGSHKTHAKFFKDTRQSELTRNWYPYGRPPRDKEETDDEYADRCEAGADYLAQHEMVKVCCKAGDAVFWYSTLAHEAVQMTPGKNDNYRLVFYASMMPRNYANPKDLGKKRFYMTTGRTTSHWASINILVNAEKPHFWSKADRAADDKFVVRRAEPVLTPRMLEMAGFSAGEDPFKEMRKEAEGQATERPNKRPREAFEEATVIE